MSRYQTRGVLGGAYRGKKGILLTHTHDTEAPPHPSIEFPSLCGRVAHLADSELAAPPTCPACLRRDPRFAKKT